LPGLDVTVSRVETLRPDMPVPMAGAGHIKLWRERIEGGAEVLDRDAEGRPVTMRAGALTYLGGWPDPDLLRHLLLRACAEAGIATLDLPPDIRIRQAGGTRFVFNHGPDAVTFDGVTLPPAGVLRSTTRPA
jgi:beta-galactosidase